MNQIKKLLTLLIIITLLLIFPLQASASSQKELEEVQRQLEEIRQRKDAIENELNSQQANQDSLTAELNRLKSQIDLLNIQISEKQLKIEELELQIKILEENIIKTEEEIVQTLKDVEKLQLETDDRLVQMYISQKMFTSLDMFLQASGTDFIKFDLYQNAIQKETNNVLNQLVEKKNDLAQQQEQLEADKKQIELDTVQIVEEKLALETDKSEIDRQRSVYYDKRNQSLALIHQSQNQYDFFTEEEKKIQAELELLKQKLFNSTNPINNGQWVKKGTIIGYEGNTGISSGPHLHFMLRINSGANLNACNHLPGAQLRNAYCGVSNPTLSQWPISTSSYLTSPFGPRGGGFHYAIDLSSGGGSPIYASHDGYISYGNDGACSIYQGKFPCNGAGANYAKITCPISEAECGGKTIETGYWHLK